jgi:hypothetical protein
MTEPGDKHQGRTRAPDDRSLEDRRLELEKRKFVADTRLRRLELELRRGESGWSSKFFTPLTTTLLAGILTLAGSVVGTIMQGRQTIELEERKFQFSQNLEKEKFDFTKDIEISKQQHELIVKMISVGDEKQARANIKFLAETGLIKDETLSKNLLAAPAVGVLPSANGLLPPGARLHVLAVGISEYGDKARPLGHQFADRDAIDVTEALHRTQENGLYAEVLTRLLTNKEATKRGIMSTFQSMNRSIRSDDTVIIMMSGYGVTIDNKFYFASYDAGSESAESLRSSAISESEILQLIDQSATRGRVLLLLDACSEKCERLPSIFGSIGITVLAAVNSKEDEKWQHSGFAKMLLEALNGAADADHDGVISAGELLDYMDRNLPILTNGEQHVAFTQTFGGDLFNAGRNDVVRKRAAPGSASTTPR